MRQVLPRLRHLIFQPAYQSAMRYSFFLSLLLIVSFVACDTPERPESPDANGVAAGTAVEDLAPIPNSILAALDSATVRQHLMVLSSDSLEGRGTGQPGEEKAIRYIAAQMEAAGLEPAGNDGFFQKVPLLGSTPTPRGPLTFTADNGETMELTFVDEFIASTDLESTEVSTSGDLVFVGYGIDAPGFDWHSFKDVDVTDKILLAFVNDPIATDEEPNLFQGDTLTYYGRWTYKYEEARRRGAKGMLLIHTVQTAGYPFRVLSNSASGEQIQLATPPENPLALKGWITRESAHRLAQMAGTTLDDWFYAANERDFQPQELPVSVAIDIDYEVRNFEGTNVIGKLAGTTNPGEAVAFTAHHDHLGVGAPDDTGDTIYNGAVDNASGVGMMLTLAKAFGQADPQPERSLLFISLTAEESGLLGAEHYARNPSIPMAQTIANLNVDSGNVYGPTEDIVGIGAEKSEMMDLLKAAAAEEGMRVSPDQQPNQGFFFRSDQLAFARAGVPAIFFGAGGDYIGQPDEYGQQVEADYVANHYHQPSDEFDTAWPMGGLVQQMKVAARIAYRLGYSTERPAWNEGEAFAQARNASE